MSFVMIMKGIHNRPETERLSPTCPSSYPISPRLTAFSRKTEHFMISRNKNLPWYVFCICDGCLFTTSCQYYLSYFILKNYFLKGARCFFTLKSHFKCNQTIAPDDLQFSIIFLKSLYKTMLRGKMEYTCFVKNQCQNNPISPWR